MLHHLCFQCSGAGAFSVQSKLFKYIGGNQSLAHNAASFIREDCPIFFFFLGQCRDKLLEVINTKGDMAGFIANNQMENIFQDRVHDRHANGVKSRQCQATIAKIGAGLYQITVGTDELAVAFLGREIHRRRVTVFAIEDLCQQRRLAKVAKEIPLVILSNAADDQIQKNVAMLGAPFHRVYTAQQAQAYKPRLKAFEYMLDSLGCNPEDVLHVSSSLRYDLMSADDIGIVNKVFVNRGHGPGNPAYRYTEIQDIGGLPGVVGL